MAVELSINISGLFCVQLLRTFIQIQVERLPESYILRRYTKFARRDLEFDRHDKVLEGEDGNTRMYRSKMLLTKAMRAVRSGSMSEAACNRGLVALDELCKELELFPHDIGPQARRGKSQATAEVSDGVWSL